MSIKQKPTKKVELPIIQQRDHKNLQLGLIKILGKAPAGSKAGAHLHFLSDESCLVVLRGHTFKMPSRTARLLYFSHDSHKNANFSTGYTFSLNSTGDDLDMQKVPFTEPSTIFSRMLLRRPIRLQDIPRPCCCPIYAWLSPEQKWVYLDWLCDVVDPIDISYVFLYYYGLERQLLFGEFEMAKDEILLLRKYHKNRSFLKYSGNALLYSCVIRQRHDNFELLLREIESPSLKDAELLWIYHAKGDLPASAIMSMAKSIDGVNCRYIKKCPDRYEFFLLHCLMDRYQCSYLPFSGTYDLTKMKKRAVNIFANISIPDDLRTPMVPSFLANKYFAGEVKKICGLTHEKVKQSLRAERIRGARSGASTQ